MSVEEQIRSEKESLIEFLKRKYTPGVKFYQWFTAFSTRRRDDGTIEHCYSAVGPRVTQDIINGLHNEEISIDDYVFTCSKFWADCNVFRPSWFTIQNHRRKRHIINCELRKNIRSKDKRRRERNECKRKLYNFLNTQKDKINEKDTLFMCMHWYH